MDFLDYTYYHNTVLEWSIALGIILGGVIVLIVEQKTLAGDWIIS